MTSAFVVVYDACVLCPNTLRDLLIRIAQRGLVQAKWSDTILDEVFRNLAADLPDVDPQKWDVLRDRMNKAVRDSRVSTFERLIDGLELPDPDDLHVLAVAIKSGAQVIVTHNLKDFPADELAEWDVEAKSPDDFIADQIYLDKKIVYGEITRIADSRKNPAQTVEDVLDQMENSGLVVSAALLRSP
ncbi:PIN domain-containing protein [Kineococcus sp. LSe6-4]|uniref:PIN domain-containing protein n=1 Tax=Kineococcus halophytocola TaxID=3234027 RepID=A0ABV4GYK6_9ACTN